MKFVYILILGIVCSLFTCTNRQETLFTLVSPSSSGVAFENTIIESDSLNALRFEYIYNGAGVGVGDFNNDDLPDLFFAGNTVSSRLYLNRREFHFEDITELSKVTTTSWCTGVAVNDFNQDGWMDIYVSTINPNPDKTSPNLLFINQGLNKDGIPMFKESAEAAGLTANAYSTQASFLDYDLDGDLDVYLVVNSLEVYPKNNPVGQNANGLGRSQDKLYRNYGDSSGLHFTDVSVQSGIQTEGWGLGIIVNDINQDGYPDIYVANDFLSNDHLYINNHDGTFSNEIKKYLKHTEFNGMGIDIADINNDGLNDIVVLDMMPDDNLRQKAMFSNTGYSKFKLNLDRNYLPQYVRNVLQLNNGNGTFSDIGCLSGVYATDWSWSPLIADFDNDGWRDILITNGYVKDITDLDFVSYNANAGAFGRPEERKKNVIDALQTLKGVYKTNHIFKNNKNLTFSDNSNIWGLVEKSYTNGAAYADLDNDGDLDIVMNNINSPAFLYKNNTREIDTDHANFIELQLVGNGKNHSGTGAKIWAYSEGTSQYAEQTLQRGYKSTVGNLIHFGFGDSKTIDSLKVVWPSGSVDVISNPSSNQITKVAESGTNKNPVVSKFSTPMFIESSHEHGLLFKHDEQDFVDFKQRQPLLLHKFSQSGPMVASGDINNDGLEDLVIGGSADHGATIFMQEKNGRFSKTTMTDKNEEDEGILLFDADGDKDLDLFCVSGSSEYGQESPYYRHRFYDNDGKGNFKLDTLALPKLVNSSGSCVAVGDFDKDGDPDLFVGGRVVPNRYPEIPRSFILQNVSNTPGNTGPRFVAIDMPDINNAGMITGAQWVDFDNDQWIDLVVVGEWMPVTFFKNENGILTKLSNANHQLPEETGWWRCIKSADFDHDGDVDFVAGSFGLNSIYTASSKEPISLYAKDFDGNGSIDPIVSRFIQGKEYPVHPRETLTEQIVSMKRVLTTYELYGNSSIQDILSPQHLEGAQIYRCDYLASSYIENLGNGNFSLHALPISCQTSTINDMIIEDFNHDGKPDILAVQNDYSFEPLGGRYDAGIGLLLFGDGKGNFISVDPRESGILINGDSKSISRLMTRDKKALYITTQNQDSLRVFELRNP